MGDLQNIFSFGLDTSKSLTDKGTSTTGKGIDALSSSLDYFKRLSSGDRTTVAGAVAPESNAVLNRADAARNQRASMGTARGGGTSSANQTEQDRTMAEIDNLLFGVRPAAAKEVADVGGKLAGVGLGEANLGLGFGELAESGASNLTKDAIASRADSFKINQDIVGQVTGSIADIIAAMF